MSTIDTGLTLLRSAAGRVSAVNGWMGNAFKGWMPTGLYARALLIMIVPMVVLQSVVAFVFMERHWNTVTRRLSAAVVQDIAALIDVYKGYPQDRDREQIRRIAQQRLGLVVDFLPAGDMPPPGPKPFFSLLDQTLSVQLGRQIGRSFWIDTVGRSNLVEIRIQLDDAVMRVFAQRSAAYASNSEIFLFWMVGTSSILLIVAVLFLRNQIKPILRLADAAESFGKGREAPNFRPRGAREVRRAAVAFLEMKSRIERTMEQRTAMLAGVSHDLRTILTRFKLELALIGDSPELEGMRKDVDEMSMMLEDYLAFARGDSGEQSQPTDMAQALEELRGRRRAPRSHRDRRLPRPARRDGEAGLVQTLPRQSRHQRGALRQGHRHHRPARSPLFDRDDRRRRPRHSRAFARRSVQAVPAARQRPQPG
ncbi:two-component system osmolarity sensor histidine kinase EnvZ [Bradyrhizobium ottawaense]